MDKITLNLIHLEDEQYWLKKFRQLMPELQRTFEEFWHDNFSPDAGCKCPVKLQLRQARNIDSLKTLLFEDDTRRSSSVKRRTLESAPTDDALHCCLFVLDYMVPQKQGDKERDLWSLTAEEIAFPAWLNLHFPAVPKLCLTRLRAEEVRKPEGHWHLDTKNSLESPDDFARVLRRWFCEWWEAPFWQALKDYAKKHGADSWHTPGHNAGNAFQGSVFQRDLYREFGRTTFATDLSVSVDALGDLSEPTHDSPLSRARRRTATVFGAFESFYITNGTSTSNKAMLMTLLRPGEVVVLDRNCHKSVHQAVTLSGAIPFYLTPRLNKRFGVWEPIPFSDITYALSAACALKGSPARLLILTTCTYEGFLYPTFRIAKVCNELGVLFYADEAWCPYIVFHPHYVTGRGRSAYRLDAMHGGAHFASQSTHKVLAAFSQASMIHISPRFEALLRDGDPQWNWVRERFSYGKGGSYERFRHELTEILRYWHSTSPHYPMLATLDRAAVQMSLEGMPRLQELLDLVENLAEEVNRRSIGQNRKVILDMGDILGQDQAKTLSNAGYMKDPTKLIVGFSSAENCKAFKEKLKSASIQWEKSTATSIEFLATLGTFKRHFEALKRVLFDNIELIGIHKRKLEEPPEVTLFDAASELGLTPRFAFNSETELVEISQAVKDKRVCAQMLVPYPPGIPVMLPGLIVSQQAATFVEEARKDGAQAVHGLFEENGKYLIKVVAKSARRKFTGEHRLEAEAIRQVNLARKLR